MPNYTTLVNATLLQQDLADANSTMHWCIVDCRHDLADLNAGGKAYQAGHIPGAVFARIEDELSGLKTAVSGRHPLPARDRFVALLRRWGINNDTQVIAYDAHGGQFAARLWWLLRWLGHANVALLDGGWQAWRSAGGTASSETPQQAQGDFTPRTSLVRVADAGEVLRTRADLHTRLIDARAPERYRGDVEPIDPVAGHIPGALNRFWQMNLQGGNLQDGRFKSAQQLRAEFLELLNGSSPQQTIAQCGSGVTACHHLLAMEIAGISGAALYAGSWSEWIRDPSRPVATGAN